MIAKINKIKDFGIFKDFKWNSNIDAFKKDNLIFGWNYSGKTTLSMLFQNLEFKSKDKYFPGSEFEINIDNASISQIINQNNINSFPFNIKVFNSEYIKRIFVWDDPSSKIEPISFYLGDPSGELNLKIKLLDSETDRLKYIRDNRYAKMITEFEQYNKEKGKFSSKAKEIRENYLNNQLDQNRLNKTTIQEITDSIKDCLESYILSDFERDKIKTEASAINTFDQLKYDFSFSENLTTLAGEVKSILEETAPKSISYPELDTNKDLFNWIQTGIRLHHNETDCKFCTSILPENRISDLNSYYSKKLQDIQSRLNKTRSDIKAEKQKLEITFPSQKELGESFRQDYQSGINEYNFKIALYKSQLEILENDLERKSTNYFNNISATAINIISFSDDFNKIKKALKDHNKWLNEFDSNKKKAIDLILKHYIADYLQKENFLKKERAKNEAMTTISQINKKISANEEEVAMLYSQLKSNVKGQTELNGILEILLHRKDIKIEIKNEKFILERSGFPANNLSEGEKSAIAFSYFLTELKSLRNDNPPKLPNSIVFIDDPISSLDSNHIFQVRSLLKDFFKSDDYAQLFISTHNFEFFSVMMDSKLFGSIGHDTKEEKRPLYFIRRKDDNSTTINKLPNSFSSYKSEYVGIFHIIKDYNNFADKENYPYLIVLPNTVRRFLELYTLMKYPSYKEVDERVKSVFNPDDKPSHNTKLLHWFSHQNQFEKIQQHDEKIFQIDDVISDLIEHIKQHDQLHWKGLTGEE